jgi:hypothetical protein
MSAATTTSVPDAPLTATPIEVEDDDDDDGPMFNDDGSAVDPDEFRRWLMSNPEKMKELEKEEHKDVAQLLLGGDNAKTQDCLRKMFALQMKHAEEDEQSKMSSPDLLRTECTVPRDPVVLYQQMLKVGLQYGPAFRLLSQVWIPQATADEQRKAALGNVSDDDDDDDDDDSDESEDETVA